MHNNAFEIRQKIYNQLEKKNIVLWDCSSAAVKFYNDNKNRLNFKLCINDFGNSQNVEILRKNLPVVKAEEYELTKQDFVVCCSKEYSFWEREFESKGFVLFEDFIDYETVRLLLSGKKIAIVSGNCQTVTICDFLREIPEIYGEYAVLRFSAHYWKSRWSIRSIAFLRSICDLYICERHREQDPRFFSSEELPEHCKIVTIPLQVSKLYWPQVNMNHNDGKNANFIRLPEGKGHAPFEVSDTNIDICIQENLSEEECVQKIMREDFYSKEELTKHFRNALRKLEVSELGCDIIISDFIREHYAEYNLYYDITHMNTELIWEIVFRILQYLGIDTENARKIKDEQSSVMCESYKVHCSELPVYPCVSKFIGNESLSKEYYNICYYGKIVKMTLEEYIRNYYRNTKAVMEVYKLQEEVWNA